MDTPSLQAPKESSSVEDESSQRILAAEQEYARKVEQVSSHWPDEGLPLIIINKLEKVIAEGKGLERERKEFERWLEVARLIGAQQALANLDMQIKLDLMRMGNLQLVSGHDFIFLCIHLHQINRKGFRGEAHKGGKVYSHRCLKTEMRSKDCHFRIIIITTISSMYEFYVYVSNFCDHHPAELSFFYCSRSVQLFCSPRLDQLNSRRMNMTLVCKCQCLPFP